MLWRRVRAAVLLCSFAGWGANPKTAVKVWYVDCGGGDDSADGSSPSTAWRGLATVKAHVFQPGDVILFRRGSVCRGLLAPKGSGTESAPIRLGAYGTGALPRIAAEPGQASAFQLLDQQYWTVEQMEFSGGDPHGVFVSGTRGVLHGIHFKDIVVHGVTGDPKTKEGGLLVIAAGSDQQRFDDVVVDGVTAYGTSQWAGILVGGVNNGFLPDTARTANVTVRNSIVHDVAGDGIVLFQVNRGIIENNVAWFTGMQGSESIGTPNAIWTWMGRGCTVRRNEAFLSDSPGVDGGAFDIDYGNDDTLLEENYGHDTQGYCVGIFGSGWVTSNSVVRNNTCVDNGRSPRLAITQGAIYLSTSNDGKLKGVEISGNRIFWNPPAAASALVNNAEFVGKGSFENNVIRSATPLTLPGDSALVMSGNSIEPYGGRITSRLTAQENVPDFVLRDAGGKVVSPRNAGQWTLLAFVAAGAGENDSRGQIALVESVHRQFPHLAVKIVVSRTSASDPESRENLRYDWNTGDLPVLFDDGAAARTVQVERVPSVVLLDPEGRLMWRYDHLTPPAELGLAVRGFLGTPNYAELVPEK
jgi:hypothetical protein